MRLRRTGTALLACCMAASMMVPTMAATHDAYEEASSDTARLVMGKILTVNQSGRFPDMKSAEFQLEAVKGMYNENTEDGLAGGQMITAAEMPMPAPVEALDHSVELSGKSAKITVGDFSTDESDSDTVKTRTTPVEIRYDRAGYYLYRLTEIGSTPRNVAGMTYDKHSYYVVVYVTNKTDADGNTIDGVYVHNITSYRSEAGGETYVPNLTDIARTTDNGGVAAKENTRDNLSKVGVSTKEQPNVLEAYRFWNDVSTQDIVVKNNVVGNLGDRNRDFSFSVEMTGLQPGSTYTTDQPAEKTEDVTSAGTDIVRATDGTLKGTSFTADESGNASISVRMKDDEVLVINGLPTTAEYQVVESPSDHIASFELTSTEANPVIEKQAGANEAPQTALSTGQETVYAEDGTVTIRFENERNAATVTGVSEMTVPFAMLALVLAGMLTRRRRRNDELR